MLWKIPLGYDISKFHSPTGYWNFINSLVFVYYMAVTNCAPPPGLLTPRPSKPRSMTTSWAEFPALLHLQSTFLARVPQLLSTIGTKSIWLGQVCFTRKTGQHLPAWNINESNIIIHAHIHNVDNIFIRPFEKRDVLCRGNVRPSVCPSVCPSVRPSAFSGLFFNMLWDINLKLGICIQ